MLQKMIFMWSVKQKCIYFLKCDTLIWSIFYARVPRNFIDNPDLGGQIDTDPEGHNNTNSKRSTSLSMTIRI